MFLEEYCSSCGTESDDKIYHHISYDPEIVETVCDSCHGKIHKDEDYRPELTPDMSRNKAEENDLIEFDRTNYNNGSRTWSVYISDDDLNERIEEELKSEKYHNQAHFFTMAVREFLENKRDGPLT